MDDEDDIIMCVTFKDIKHNLGIMNLNRFSRVSLINKVLMRAYERKMKFDE